MNILCPRCRKETAFENNPFQPFCSERCKLIDLGNWASDRYRIHSERKNGEDQGFEDAAKRPPE